MLSERQLIARGRALLQAYQSQKQQWLKRTETDGNHSSVNIFEHLEPLTLEHSSPITRHLSTIEASSIATKEETMTPLPISFLNSTTTEIDSRNNGPLSTSERTVPEPLLVTHDEQHWTDFMQLLKTHTRTMEMLDTQLNQLWGDLVSVDENASESVKLLHIAGTQVLQQKQEVEVALLKLVEVLGSQVFLTGFILDENVQVGAHELRLTLETSEKLVDSLMTDMDTLKLQDGFMNKSADAMVTSLQQQLRDKGEQLQASEATIAALKHELKEEKQKAAKNDEKSSEPEIHEIGTQCSHAPLPVKPEQSPALSENLYEQESKSENDLLEPLKEHTSQQQEIKVFNSQTLDVIFQDTGPIGLHFQANVPDAGATVRAVLPATAAAKKKILKPFDQLVAVNQIAVHTAPFRHIMLLLQGGLRPLTLTFKRFMPVQEALVLNDDNVKETDLDEEVVLDEGTLVDLEQLRVPVLPLLPESTQNNEMNAADVLLSSLFSLFWNPPTTTTAVADTI